MQKRGLKQAFRQGKELQEEFVLLSNIFSNRLDDLVNSFDNNNVISHHQRKNATSSQLLVIGKNRVTSHSGIEKKAARKNRIASYSEIKPGIENANGDLSDARFSIKK